MSTDAKIPVEYARKLYDDVRGWYSSADGKAQVILAIDGAFLAFFTGAMFSKPTDLKPLIDSLPAETWAFLVLTGVCLLASVSLAIMCLWSRTYSPSERTKFVREAQQNHSSPDLLPPSTMWFFQFIAHHDRSAFVRTLEAIDAAFELRSLASQIQILSANVQKKHSLVNMGFILAAATLVSFFLAGVGYMLQFVVQYGRQ